MQLLAGLGPLGVPELLIIALIVVLVFGVGRLPEVGGAVGKSIREFRKATKDDDVHPSDATSGTVTSTGTPSSWGTDASASSTVPSDTIFCNECGTRNARSAKFCAQCGHTTGAPVG